MPSTGTWFSSTTLYKGLFFLILVFIALEYLFGTISIESRHFFIFNNSNNTTRSPPNHGPLLRQALFRSRPTMKTNMTVGDNATSIYVTELIPNVTMSDLVGPSNFSNHDKGDEAGGTTDVPPCPEVSPYLMGNVPVVKSPPVPTLDQLESRFSTWLKAGGHYAPVSCKVQKSVALVVPFRCRGEHLILFLQHMHPFLKRQQIDYTIFIIEQEGDKPFNRAMLMNVGFTEALKIRQFDCFIFHDIDLLPENDKNLYTCPGAEPRHMSVAVDIFNYRLPYRDIFGGVSAINTDHFKLLNGFSNSFWGWGGEDDDMSNRIKYHNLYISRYPMNIAKYTMLQHKKGKPSPNRYDVLKKGPKRFDKDGLSNLKYTLVQKKENLLYTWLLVQLEVPS